MKTALMIIFALMAVAGSVHAEPENWGYWGETYPPVLDTEYTNFDGEEYPEYEPEYMDVYAGTVYAID
jgi:hypothetical protein